MDDTEIAAALAELPGWTRQGTAIHKTYEHPDFIRAIEWVNRVADLAEAANHHPDIDIRWNKVTLTLTSHSAGGLTKKDLILASEIDQLSR